MTQATKIMANQMLSDAVAWANDPDQKPCTIAFTRPQLFALLTALHVSGVSERLPTQFKVTLQSVQKSLQTFVPEDVALVAAASAVGDAL
ncbi:hypothetical protein SH661x_000389 [Planctomicrobium sp. SH661]|uniref:hypothetical protein n=1 Tax=Planctomicrobium sp. SH661 TaxID=3448124 RepID=UPI003F5C3416